MAKQKKYIVTKQQLVDLCIQTYQSCGGNMKFESMEEEVRFFGNFVKRIAAFCEWEEVEE